MVHRAEIPVVFHKVVHFDHLRHQIPFALFPVIG
jgi:hypothetical protein